MLAIVNDEEAADRQITQYCLFWKVKKIFVLTVTFFCLGELKVTYSAHFQIHTCISGVY